MSITDKGLIARFFPGLVLPRLPALADVLTTHLFQSPNPLGQSETVPLENHRGHLATKDLRDLRIAVRPIKPPQDGDFLFRPAGPHPGSLRRNVSLTTGRSVGFLHSTLFDRNLLLA